MNITGMVAMLVYLVIACSQLRMRGKLRAEGKEPLVRMWLFPWLTWAVIIFIVAALITMVFVDEYRTVVLSTGAAALAVVAVGLLRHGRGARAPARRAGLSRRGRRSPALACCPATGAGLAHRLGIFPMEQPIRAFVLLTIH